MKLTAGQVWEATRVIQIIIDEKRAMPLKGKYRLARMYAKLRSEYNTIEAQRQELVEPYNPHLTEWVADPVTKEMKEVPAAKWDIPAAEVPEFMVAWKVVTDQEIEVDVEPIPLDQLDSVEAGELLALGDLVTE